MYKNITTNLKFDEYIPKPGERNGLDMDILNITLMIMGIKF